MRSWAPPSRAPAASIIFCARFIIRRIGFVAGWISATVGFAAPVAIAAIPFGTYLVGRCAGHESALLVARGGLDHDPGFALGFEAGKWISKHLHTFESGADFGDHRRRILREGFAADLVPAGQDRPRVDREPAVRDQPLLGDVCLLGLERLDLYRRRSAQSDAHHSALARARHAFGHGALSRNQRRLSAHHSGRGNGRETRGRVDRGPAYFWHRRRPDDGRFYRARAWSRRSAP